MARVLTMQECVVAPAERGAYLAALAERRQRAAAVSAHFWVFEHATESGRFVEFTEAAGEAQLAALQDAGTPPDRWREVQGG
ncbi:MAG: hypothetical protein P3B76_00155 [Gemmatimonadota bacterium]|jgi:hypothetical protein|nr:hypothetical protein [Gemmatimonadota bacterium]MDQ8166647.1 hypothetical protein [Gemmatimonadota bacterium]MDQ8171070.1 hypothetical protein [Gemmatimonadota bacterium]